MRIDLTNKKSLLTLLPVLLLATLTGCNSLQKPDEPESTEPKPLPFYKLSVPKAELIDDSPLQVDEPEVKKTPEISRADIPSRPQTARSESAASSDYPDNLIKGITAPDTKLKVNLQFDASTIDEVVAAFADKDILNFSFLVDPNVKGAITMSVDAELTAREAWETFEHILWLSGAYASKNPGFIHILPFEKMPKERRIYADHDKQPNVEVIILNLKYKKSSDMINYLRPFMTDGAVATDVADSNSVIIVEAPANVNKLLELVKRLDVKGESEWPVKCYICHSVDPDVLAEELNTLLPVLGFPIAQANAPSGGAIKITSIPRLKSIVISASMQEVLDEIGTWIKSLDREDAEDKEEIYFYNVKHATVDSLSAALDTFFLTTTTSNSSSSSSNRSTSSRTSASSGNRSTSTRNRTTTYNRNRSTNSSQNTNNANRPGGTTTNNTSPTSRSNTSRTTTSGTVSTSGSVSITQNVFDTDVTVYTDDESNRITVKTTPRAWNMIKVFLARQDVPPKQVAIQAIITEITLSKDTEYGISYAINKMVDHAEDTLAGAYSGAGAIPEAISGWSSGGLGILFRDKANDPLAYIKAVAGKANTKILSEPQVVARSGAKAELQVGMSVPVATESTSYTSSSGNFSTNYEYVETGVIMEVTPYITAGNDVRIEIEQEVSSAIAQTDTAIASNVPPSIDKKKMSTELVVPDNTTLLMGGMIQTQDRETYSGIPLLMDIPYIGAIFRSNSKEKVRTELLLLLTVNVIDSKNPQEELIRKYRASLEEIEKLRSTETLY
ncbi:MAG: hypothetical protein IKP58_07285 [Victivallales bacterium]|nr:hypothetical protein [Victivallales bacterium]